MFTKHGINKYDWQYLLTAFILISIFICTDLLGVLNKEFLYYLPQMISKQPHRILSSTLIHSDLNHLISNLGGIVINRYFLKQLGMKSKYFYMQFIIIFLLFNFIILWIFDRILTYQFNIIPNYAYLGFSGIIYAFLGFILLTSFFGKDYFLGFKIDFNKNREINKMSKTICLIGLIFSFIPGVSFVGHVSGFITGCFIFLI